MSSTVALLSDRQLGALVEAAPLRGAGIGGVSLRLEIGNVPVFVKRVPLTDLERRPEHLMSTANLFGLPTCYQYGVGSAGFGAWRELAAHAMTTAWVLERRSESFPLMYHWRALPGPPPRPPGVRDPAELARTVAYWHGSPAVRARLEAIEESSASLVLFLEDIPQDLRAWLAMRAASGPDAVDAACAMVERCLRADVPRMNSHGLTHFDAHFRNVLTDGGRLYFSDFGLAMSPRFELSAVESAFLEANRDHDRWHTATELVKWLASLAGAANPVECRDTIRRCAEGGHISGLPPVAATVMRRYAPVAAVVYEFYWQLWGTSRATPYPADEIRRVCAEHGLAADSPA